MSKFVSIKAVARVSAFSLLFILLYQLIPKKNIADRITEGDLQYTKELGWINWGHAQKKSTQQAYNLLVKLNNQCDSSFEYKYAQQMFYAVGPLGIRASQSATYTIYKINSLQQLQSVFFEILKHTSNSFEKMQGAFPYNLFKSIGNSSFREGDLMGNLISYYAVINDLPLAQIKQEFNHNTSVQSLEKLEQSGIQQALWSDVAQLIKDHELLRNAYQVDLINEGQVKLIREELSYSFE